MAVEALPLELGPALWTQPRELGDHVKLHPNWGPMAASLCIRQLAMQEGVFWGMRALWGRYTHTPGATCVAPTATINIVVTPSHWITAIKVASQRCNLIGAAGGPHLDAGCCAADSLVCRQNSSMTTAS